MAPGREEGERRRRPPRPAPAAGAPRGATLALLAITLVAAALRFVRLGHSPPGFNQDEAVNAWNAWCLLRTGKDMTGAHWPVFYSHAIGDNRTTLFFYLLMPFQALFGLGVTSTRLPAAFFGTLAVPLAGFVAGRWWGRRAGLVAAALLAVDPWQLFLSRWGIEGSVTPFLALLPLALLTAAGLLPRASAPRWPLALAAGLAAGIATYGYWSMRLWIPAWLVATALCAGPAVIREWCRGAALRAWLAFKLGLLVTFGPLVWRHLTDPAIAQRATMTRLWEPGASPFEIARLVAGRWLLHFGPRFLFVSGDTYELLQPPVDGAVHRFLAPLLLAGLAAAIVRFRRDASARALLALVAVYPAGDLLARYDGVHSLRSAAGIGALVLLATYGAEAAWGWLAARGRGLARGAAVAFAALALAFVVRALVVFYGEYDRRPLVAASFQSDLLAAARDVKPKLAGARALFCTTQQLLEPWATVLVEVGYDPRRWFAEPRELVKRGGWDDYRRVGKLFFIHDLSAKRAADSLQANGRPDSTLFIVRPGELGLQDPAFVVKREGRDVMWVVEGAL